MARQVSLPQQVRLAERIADHLLEDDYERLHSSFAARVLEYVHEPDRDTSVDLPPLAPWTADEVKDIENDPQYR